MPFYILPHKYLIYSFCSATLTFVRSEEDTTPTHTHAAAVAKGAPVTPRLPRLRHGAWSTPSPGRPQEKEEEQDRQAILKIPVTIYMSTKETGIHSGERTRKKRQRYFLST